MATRANRTITITIDPNTVKEIDQARDRLTKRTRTWVSRSDWVRRAIRFALDTGKDQL